MLSTKRTLARKRTCLNQGIGVVAVGERQPEIHIINPAKVARAGRLTVLGIPVEMNIGCQ
jgi:hypothetical protein